jgi:hypothetical protein
MLFRCFQLYSRVKYWLHQLNDQKQAVHLDPELISPFRPNFLGFGFWFFF